MQRYLSLSPLSLLLLATTSLPCLAQSGQGGPIGQAPPLVLDVDATGSVQARPVSFLRLGAQDQAGSDVLVPTFKRFAADARQLRFDGEMGVNDLPVYVRPDQIAEQAKLRLRYLSSVSVMPEASRMQVFVNDQQLAEVVLDASAEYGMADIDIPVGLLQPGYNMVRFSVQQRHRVDCSIEAANELWTQIEPAGSGLALTSSNDKFTAIDELVGFPEDEDGSVRITVALPQGADIAMMDRALRAVQGLAIRADIQKPKIIFARGAVPTSGILLLLGTSAELRSLGVEDLTPGENGIFVSGRGSTVVRVAISGQTPADIDTALLRLGVERKAGAPRGTPAGLRALAFQRGVPVNAENEISLSSAGIASQDFSGRVFRTDFNIVLPKDFYPADNGKATLLFDGEYVAGLLNSNEALVRVNGKVVGASRLTRSGGETINHRPIEVSLRTLSPGYNRVTLEVRTATEDDRDCNPLSLIDSRKRLSVQATTAFQMPRFARAEHLPNLAAMATTGYPFRTQSGRMTVYMPKPDMATLSAAATFLARTAVAAGSAMQASVSLRAPTDQSGSTLIVGAIGDIPDGILSHFGVNLDMIPERWILSKRRNKAGMAPQAANETAPVQLASASGAAASTDTAKPAAAAPLTLPKGAIQVAALTGGNPLEVAADRELAKDAISERKTEALSWVDRALNGTSSFLQRNVGYSPEQLWFLNRGRSSIVAPPNSTLLLAEARSLSSSRESWLLLTGPDVETLQKDTTELVSPSNWQQLAGRMVAFDPTARELTHFPPGDHYYVSMQERSLGNLTLFAAGWLSNHIQYYVLVLLAVCLAFGVFSRKLLNRIGVKP